MNTRNIAHLALLSVLVFLTYKYIQTKDELELCNTSSDQYVKTISSVQEQLQDEKDQSNMELISRDKENSKLSSNLDLCESSLETVKTKYAEVKDLLRSKSDIIVGLNQAQDQQLDNIKSLKDELITSVNTVKKISKDLEELKEENKELRATATAARAKIIDMEEKLNKKRMKKKLADKKDLEEADEDEEVLDKEPEVDVAEAKVMKAKAALANDAKKVALANDAKKVAVAQDAEAIVAESDPEVLNKKEADIIEKENEKEEEE